MSTIKVGARVEDTSGQNLGKGYVEDVGGIDYVIVRWENTTATSSWHVRHLKVLDESPIAPRTEPSAKPGRCRVFGCTNHSDQGLFANYDICAPCWRMITEGVAMPSENFITTLRVELKDKEDLAKTLEVELREVTDDVEKYEIRVRLAEQDAAYYHRLADATVVALNAITKAMVDK